MWEILSICLTALILVRLILFCSWPSASSSDGPLKAYSVASAPWKTETSSKTLPLLALKNDSGSAHLHKLSTKEDV